MALARASDSFKTVRTAAETKTHYIQISRNNNLMPALIILDVQSIILPQILVTAHSPPSLLFRKSSQT